MSWNQSISENSVFFLPFFWSFIKFPWVVMICKFIFMFTRHTSLSIWFSIHRMKRFSHVSVQRIHATTNHHFLAVLSLISAGSSISENPKDVQCQTVEKGKRRDIIIWYIHLSSIIIVMWALVQNSLPSFYCKWQEFGKVQSFNSFFLESPLKSFLGFFIPPNHHSLL